MGHMVIGMIAMRNHMAAGPSGLAAASPARAHTLTAHIACPPEAHSNSNSSLLVLVLA